MTVQRRSAVFLRMTLVVQPLVQLAMRRARVPSPGRYSCKTNPDRALGPVPVRIAKLRPAPEAVNTRARELCHQLLGTARAPLGLGEKYRRLSHLLSLSGERFEVAEAHRGELGSPADERPHGCGRAGDKGGGEHREPGHSAGQ